jgi:hypothetical protein
VHLPSIIKNEVYTSTENDVSITENENDKYNTYKKSSNDDTYVTIMEVHNTPVVNYHQYYIKNGWK